MARTERVSGDGRDPLIERVMQLQQQVNDLTRQVARGGERPVALIYDDETGTTTAAVQSANNLAKMQAPVVVLAADHQGTPESGVHRNVLHHLDEAGVPIPQSVLEHIIKSTGESVLANPHNNIGMVPGSGTMYVSDAAGLNPKPIAASGFPTWSSRKLKDRITDLDYDPLDRILSIPIQRWFYQYEIDDPDIDEKAHIGPMAEDVPPELRVEGFGGAMVDMAGLASLAAAAVQRLHQITKARLDEVTSEARSAVRDLRQENAAQKAQLTSQAEIIAALSAQYAALVARVAALEPSGQAKK